MGLFNSYIQKYAAARRSSVMSQTTTHKVNGQSVFRETPEAKLPAFPVLSFRSLSAIFSEKPVTALDHGYPCIPVTAARYAITHALRILDIKAGDEVLLPAYHCTVMVAPIVKVGAKPVFFKIKPNLDSDTDDMIAKITPKTKAIIAVNYCGFIQNMAAVHALCLEKNIPLIEDCAHSFFGQKDGNIVGKYGDFILVSTRKFFPVSEGGSLLIKPPYSQKINQKKRTLIASLRSNFALIERSLKYGKLWLLAPLVEFLNFVIKHIKKLTRPATIPHKPPLPSEVAASLTQDIKEGENAYLHEMADKQAVWTNKIIPKILNSVYVTNRRRENFIWLQQRFKKMENCRLLIDELPDGTIPFMFPVYIDNLQKYFPAIEDAAIPLQRFAQFLWNDEARNTCPITADYSDNVILFPCHQELSQQDLQWLENTIRNILEKD